MPRQGLLEHRKLALGLPVLFAVIRGGTAKLFMERAAEIAAATVTDIVRDGLY